MRIRYILPLLLLLASCSFNKLFLQPTKVPPNIHATKYILDGDTTSIAFDTLTHQPHYTFSNPDDVPTDYTIESVNFLSKNGNLINGWLLKPKDKPAEITILHLHGNAGFLPGQISLIAPLVKDGFQVLMFDYSGFGFSNGKATRKNLLIDANAALDYLKTIPGVEKTPIILYGQSLGGHAAAVLAENRENEIKGLVIEGAFSSHKDIAAESAGIFGRIFVKEMYSAKKSIQQLHIPVLIIHSTEDEVIPYKMGEKLFDLANNPKQFYTVDHEHICANLYYSDSIALKIKNLISGR